MSGQHKYTPRQKWRTQWFVDRDFFFFLTGPKRFKAKGWYEIKVDRARQCSICILEDYGR